jgi:hypothetical protein
MRGSSFAARLGAEFGVIVLGVLVALWADAWAGQRAERAVERTRLEALREDVVSTLADVRSEHDNARGAVEALRGLLPEATAGLPPEELRERLAYGLLYGPSFHPELSVYDDLKNSGELGLLTDPALRRALSVMDARVQRLRLTQDDLTTVQQLNVDGYLLRNLPLRTVAAPFLDIEPASNFGPADAAPTRSRAFENLVVFKLDLVRLAAEAFASLEEALVEVRDHIDRQVGADHAD